MAPMTNNPATRNPIPTNMTGSIMDHASATTFVDLYGADNATVNGALPALPTVNLNRQAVRGSAVSWRKRLLNRPGRVGKACPRAFDSGVIRVGTARHKGE